MAQPERFLEAARTGDLDGLQDCLTRGVPVDSCDKVGCTALHWAAHRNQLAAAEYLIKQGANINAVDAQEKSPLHFAAFRGNMDICKELVKNGALVDVQSLLGEAPLHLAAVQGHVAVVEFLLRENAVMDVRASDGETPLQKATLLRKSEVVALLTRKSTAERALSFNKGDLVAPALSCSSSGYSSDGFNSGSATSSRPPSRTLSRTHSAASTPKRSSSALLSELKILSPPSSPLSPDQLTRTQSSGGRLSVAFQAKPPAASSRPATPSRSKPAKVPSKAQFVESALVVEPSGNSRTLTRQSLSRKDSQREMGERQGWTATELGAKSMFELGCMFAGVLDGLDLTLRTEDRLDLLRLLRERVLPVLVVSRELLTVAELAWGTGVDSTEVQVLARHLSKLFPSTYTAAESSPHHEAGLAYLQPCHRYLREWLASDLAEAHQVDEGAGHLCLAQACRSQLEELGQQVSGELPPLPKRQVGAMYALRHCVAHACQADSEELLQAALHDLVLWEATYAAGFGPDVLVDLLLLSDKTPSASADIVEDTLRWLRSSNAYLVKHPRAALQLACDAPHNSLMAKYANGLPCQPATCLINKEDEWPSYTATLKLHTAEVTSVAISPDCSTIVSGSADKTIRVWDLLSGQCRMVLQEHTAGVTSVAITPDGRAIVSGSQDGCIRVWEIVTGRCKYVLKGHTKSVTSAAVSPDCKSVVSSSKDTTLRVWDLATGECLHILKGHTHAVNIVAISPSSRTAASGSDDKVVSKVSPTCLVQFAILCCTRLWDLASGREKNTPFEKHFSYVTALAFTPDGKTIISGSDNGLFWTWDVKYTDTRRLNTIQRNNTGGVAHITVSANGQSVVIGSTDKSIRVWDLTSDECEKELLGHTHGVTGVAVSADGRTIVSSAFDETVRVWDVTSMVVDSVLDGHTRKVHNVAISADGRTIVSESADSTIRVWDLASGLCTSKLKSLPYGRAMQCVALSPDGKNIVIGTDYALRVIDVASDVLRSTLEGHTQLVDMVTISPDGKTIVSSAHEHVTTSVRVWDLVFGTAVSALTGRDAADQLQIAKGWRHPLLADRWLLQTDNGEVVDMVARGGVQSHFVPVRVHILPPFLAAFMYLAPNGKLMSVFDKQSGRYLCYQIK